MNEEGLEKIHIDLPNHWGASGESMWGLPLGNDVYEVRNVPFYAYNINFLDDVLAIPVAPGMVPEIRRIVRRSGHNTIRVIFFDRVPQPRRIEILDSLADLHVSYEGASPKYFALDLEPDADIAAVRARLDLEEANGTLEYETCEEKVPNSFDDALD
jgi:hypothetical protein